MKLQRIIFSFKSLKVSDLIKLIRLPNLLIILLSQYFVAIFLIGAGDSFTIYLFDLQLFQLGLSTILIASGGYVINDYYDIKIDYLNRPGRVVVGSAMKRRVALVLHGFFSFTGIVLGLMLSIYIGAIELIVVFMLWLYSNQLKRMPLLGNITISILTSVSLLVLLFLYNTNTELVLIYSVFAFFVNLIREIIKDMEDLKGDKAFGCKTLPIIWGIRKTKYFIYLIMFIFIILISWLTFDQNNYFLKIYFAILVLPAGFFIHRLMKSDTVNDFSRLSLYSKLIMLSGIVSMVFFKLINS